MKGRGLYEGIGKMWRGGKGPGKKGRVRK